MLGDCERHGASLASLEAKTVEFHNFTAVFAAPEVWQLLHLRSVPVL